MSFKATTNESEDMDYLLGLKKKTRTALTELVATFPVESMESLDQTNEIIRGALDDASEVSLGTQVGLIQSNPFKYNSDKLHSLPL